MPDKNDIPIVAGPGEPVLVTISAQALPPLRDGSVGALGNAAEALSEAVSTSPRARRREWWRAPLARLDGVRALLDELGWDGDDPSVQLDVDLREHGQAVQEALAVALPTCDADFAEAAAIDADRAERGLLPKHEATVRRVRAFRGFATVARARLDALSREEPVR